MIELRAENCQYVNTINWLLIGVVEQKDMAVFLAEPGGARWKDEKFDRKLKKRLGASYVSYLEVVEHLKSITESFMGRLKLNSAGQVDI